ncbi:MAG TPA: transglutaminase domain-containing protein [Myxococcota bacterium]|nr:transglutaminase domain-containing protein [Myxococcota bacterium]
MRAHTRAALGLAAAVAATAAARRGRPTGSAGRAALVMAWAAAVAAGGLGPGTARASDAAVLVVYAGELPIGRANVELGNTKSGDGWLRVEAAFEWIAFKEWKKARTTVNERCGPDGEVRALSLVSETSGRPEHRVTVGEGRLEVRDGDALVLSRRLPPRTIGLGCLLLRGEIAPARRVFAHALSEEQGLLGSAELSVEAAADGARRLEVIFRDEAGGEQREEAVVAGAGEGASDARDRLWSLRSARSFSTGIRYETPRPGEPPPRPAPILFEGAPAALDPPDVRALVVRLDGRLVKGDVSPPPSPELRADVLAALEAARVRWESAPAATCVDYAETARAALAARGRAVRLVTGWVVLDRTWRLHRWVEYRDGGAWVAMDPALGQVAADATHVPLLAHGAGPEAALAVAETLARSGRLAPVLVSWEK